MSCPRERSCFLGSVVSNDFKGKSHVGLDGEEVLTVLSPGFKGVWWTETAHEALMRS